MDGEGPRPVGLRAGEPGLRPTFVRTGSWFVLVPHVTKDVMGFTAFRLGVRR